MKVPIGILDNEKLNIIHANSLEILESVGIRFSSLDALTIFKNHGFRVVGEKVLFKESDIMAAVKTVPKEFILAARNTDRSRKIGGSGKSLIPGYGAPFIIDAFGNVRKSALKDMEKFYKLTHMSDCLNINSSIIVQPSDVDSRTAHLDLLLSMMLLSDKPIMASSVSGRAAIDSLNMAKIVWGDLEKPAMIGLINSLSPLRYAEEMADALLVFAKAGQPVLIHSACSMGTTGPITMAGSLVLSNAANLAGICLTQLINPGTPVIYSLGGSSTDMRQGNFVNASPEDAKHILASKALANYYNMPCRGLGTVTDSFCLDYQTGIESAFLSVIASLSGVDIIFHSCGIVGSMLYMSYEKFIADVELWRMINSFETPMEWSQDALAIDLIKKIGQEGNYLVEEHTLNRCRDEFFIPELGVRMEYSQWQEWDKKEIKERAKHLLNVKLSSYKKPYIEKNIAKQLIGYVHGRKNDQ